MPREILEFLEFSSSSKERGRSIVFSRPSDFIDDYMVKMEDQLQNLSWFGEQAFMPGNQEDSIQRTGIDKADFKEFMVKILRREKFYRVKADYLATELNDESRNICK